MPKIKARKVQVYHCPRHTTVTSNRFCRCAVVIHWRCIECGKNLNEEQIIEVPDCFYNKHRGCGGKAFPVVCDLEMVPVED